MEVDREKVHVASELTEEAQYEEGQRSDRPLAEDSYWNRCIVAREKLDAHERDEEELLQISAVSFHFSNAGLTPNMMNSKIIRGSNHA